MCTVLDTSHTIPPPQEAVSAPCLLVCVPKRCVSRIGGADGEAIRTEHPTVLLHICACLTVGSYLPTSRSQSLIASGDS